MAGDDDVNGQTLCPSWAAGVGYLGVASAVVLSNWGSAVSTVQLHTQTPLIAAGSWTEDMEIRVSSVRKIMEWAVPSLVSTVLLLLHFLVLSHLLSLSLFFVFVYDIYVYHDDTVGNVEIGHELGSHWNPSSKIGDEKCHSGGHGGRYVCVLEHIKCGTYTIHGRMCV
jgi:hypothetical protein